MLMEVERALKRVDSFWAGYFGCVTEQLWAPGTVVVPHAALRGFDGVLVFRRDPGCIVSVPDSVPEPSRWKLRGVSPEKAFDPEFLAKALVVWPDQVSPEGWVGVCRPEDFTPVPSGARFLTEYDLPEIRNLARELGEPVGWGLDPSSDREATFGIFEGGELIAASGYVNLSETLAYIGVVTHPRFRGRGHAKAAASACIEYALDLDLVPIWRSLTSNRGAVAAARSLGFRPYAFTLEVRLTQDCF